MGYFKDRISVLLLQLLCLILISSAAQSQSASEIKSIFAQAESYYLYEEYELANQLYLLLETPDNLNIKYKIGTCYLNIPGEKGKAITYLEMYGFEVDVVEKVGRFIKVKDCFGLADLIAIKPSITMLVQVCCNVPHTHKLYCKFAKKYATNEFIVLQMVWKDRKGFSIYNYTSDGDYVKVK